jgi:glyoxylase-like metal-dependent hydrolase (beta-lactamase superfamily II)
VADPVTLRAAVIDPVLDYDHKDGSVDVRSVEVILQAARDGGLSIEWVLETHAHADHLSGAPYVKSKTGARIGIGEHIKDVQRIFRPLFNAENLRTDESDFDRLFADGETFLLGELTVEALYTPGHTPADLSYRDRRCGVRRRHPGHAGLRHRARIFRAATRGNCIAQSSDCWGCRRTRGCSCANAGAEAVIVS